VLDGVKKYWEDYYKGLPIEIVTPDLIDKIHPPDDYDILAQELDVVGPATKDLDEYSSFIAKLQFRSIARHLLGGSVKSSNGGTPACQK